MGVTADRGSMFDNRGNGATLLCLSSVRGPADGRGGRPPAWKKTNRAKEIIMDLNALKRDCALKQKKGLHIILSSVIIWTAILCVHLTSLPIQTKNLLTFCCTAPLMPISLVVSKLIGVDFQNKGNPLMKLGLLFTLNQLLYLLIVMWVYAEVPDKMLMTLTMVFGAHLLPYSWLYDSRTYLVISIAVPPVALILGLMFPPCVLAGVMVGVEIVFSLLLWLESRAMEKTSSGSAE